MIKGYGMSMQHGNAHTSQSLPRMLTLWFDFGTYLHGVRTNKVGFLMVARQGGSTRLRGSGD